MNGNIVRVLVVGNRFQTGVTLLLLDAMKIEQANKASNFGTVIEMLIRARTRSWGEPITFID